MKHKVKKIAALGLALCAVVAGACVMSACGSTNYSNYTYENWAAMEDEDWDAKTISYQFESGPIIGGQNAEQFSFLINCYKDGTVLIWQTGLYFSLDENAHWVDEDRHVAWALYGLWEEKDDTLKIHCYNAELAEKTAGTKITVSMDEGWQMDEDVRAKHCYEVIAKKGTGGAYVIESGCGLSYYGHQPNKPAFPVNITSGWVAAAGENAVYKTLQSYVDHYMADEEDFVTG